MPLRLNCLTAMFAPGRLGGQTLLTFGFKMWSAAASFGLSWLIARSYGAAGSGFFAIGVTTVTILSYVILVGLDYIVVRDAAGDLREGKKDSARGVVRSAVLSVAVLGPLVAGTLWLARDWVAVEILRQPTMTAILGIMLWAIIPLALQRIASAALRASNRIVASQVIDGPLGTTVAVTGVAAGMWFGNPSGLLLPATLYLVGISVGSFVGWMVWRSVVRDWPRATPALLAPMLIAGLPVIASNLSNMFTEWYTTVSLGSLWSAAEVGHYRAAWQFVALAGLVQVAMDTVIGPRIAAAARVGQLDEIASVARRSIGLVLVLGSPIFIALIVFPGPLLGIFGPEFREGATALQILATGQLIRLASGPLGNILLMTGQQRWILAYAGVGMLSCIVAVALLVPEYGAEGAAWATAIAVTLRSVGAFWVVQRRLGINLLRRRRRA